MNKEQLEKMKNGKGFIAALDQSGGSTPKALKEYGVNEDQYSNEDEMFPTCSRYAYTCGNFTFILTR